MRIRTSTHLLSQHNRTRRNRGTSETRNGEKLNKSGHVVALDLDETSLGPKLSVNIVEIASSLEFRVAESLQRLKRFLIPSFLDVPPWRF